jgi:hypothetical protein
MSTEPDPIMQDQKVYACDGCADRDDPHPSTRDILTGRSS